VGLLSSIWLGQAQQLVRQVRVDTPRAVWSRELLQMIAFFRPLRTWRVYHGRTYEHQEPAPLSSFNGLRSLDIRLKDETDPGTPSNPSPWSFIEPSTLTSSSITGVGHGVLPEL
jgi:hypothetical protein